MIRQTIVPAVLRPEVPENQTKFIQALSESLQGLQEQLFKFKDGALKIMTFGPIVFIRYDGPAKDVELPFRADADMPLVCIQDGVSGYITDKHLIFNKEGFKIASGWCVSGGNKFGKKEKEGGE
jgi:hypothetical protein